MKKLGMVLLITILLTANQGLAARGGGMGSGAGSPSDQKSVPPTHGPFSV